MLEKDTYDRLCMIMGVSGTPINPTPPSEFTTRNARNLCEVLTKEEGFELNGVPELSVYGTIKIKATKSNAVFNFEVGSRDLAWEGNGKYGEESYNGQNYLPKMVKSEVDSL